MSRKRMARPAPVSRVLNDYLESSGLALSLLRTGALEAWPEVVGPRIAGVSRAVEARGGTLVVEVMSSAWLNELTMMREEILKRFNESEGLPAFDALRFRLAGPPGTADSGGRDKSTHQT